MTMIDLQKYRENAKLENLCDEYTEKWDSCRSHKQYIDMALSTKGLDYLCDSIAKGWGISPEYIQERFSSFINGRYNSEQKGYNSKLYCLYDGVVKADTTIFGLIDCNVDVHIGDFHICEIYVTGKCNINVVGNGRAVFVCYGNPEDINIQGMTKNTKRINKKNRDNYNNGNT